MPKAHPNNAPGPFYVEDGCCTACGMHETIAPKFFTWDETTYPGHCFVSRQPETGPEVDLMIEAMEVWDLGCLRYRGNDGRIRKRLVQMGLSRQVD